MENNRVLEKMSQAFEKARRDNCEMFVAFTYSLRFDVFATDYETKLELYDALKECEAEGLLTYRAVSGAKKFFEQERPGGARVIHHYAKDSDISVDREEVWMFHNFVK